MHNPSDIERVVMRRVHTIRLLRPLVSLGALAALALAAALWGIGQEVWVARVFENAQSAHGPVALGRFYLAAFENTRLAVQTLTLATLFSLVYLAHATARPIADLLAAPLRARV